ncbi:hypothetical protein ABZU32_07485 [Sphaerisporangium sp. NPDC005288]|uniref:hypothetical protein n=1 Tax=Sphaerisporangium sp. NPDC005288 TaxID=3155114 RepID=UPI0033A2B17D
MTAAADMTCLAGWMAFDVGRNGLAQRHFAQALRMAKAADDSVMAGWILGVMSHQAIYLDRPTEALRLANAAADAARQANAPARLTGRLALGSQALATALVVRHADTNDLHTVRQVERLLGEAERAYAQEPTDREPAWLPPYDSTKIVSEAARSWHMLGRHQRAIERAEAALGAQKGTTRSAQLARINAAEAYLGAAELEQALDHAGAVIPTIPSLSSPRLTGRVRRFAATLEPYGDHVGVRAFREQVRAQAAA